ncbi:poly [ADP-ribose] polymerase-like isoform X2 [Zerene cesonia]|nr:poly [ADP-ribose] polymerase-like isoform X2 [Zerene cesonia]
MPGFELLSSEDKENVKNNIRPHAQKPTMKHKIVPERNTVRRNNDEEIRLQNDTFHKHKRALRALSKGELEILCKRNEMKLLKGTEEPLDLLADCMTFGVLQKCPECQGQLQLKSLNYECTGHRDEWSSCNYQTKKPRRKLMEIPPELQKYQAFKDYVPTLGERIFNDERLIEIHPPRPKKPRAANVHAPLKNVQFFIYGLKAERKEAVKRRVLRLGGRAVPQLVPTVAAVLSAPDALAKPSTVLEKIEIGGIHVIDEKYLDEIESTPGIELIGALSLIEKHNFADWAFDVLSRVPQDVVEGRPVKVSGNLSSPKSTKPEISTNKVKGDTANGKRKSFKDAFDKYLDESTKNDTGQAAKTVEALPWGQDASFLQPYLAFVSPDSNVQSFNESEDSIYEEPGLQSQYPQASAQLTCELEVPGTLTQYPQTTTQHTHLRLNEPIISSPHTDQNNRKRTFDLNESQVDRFISLLNNRKDDMEHDETDLIFLGYARTLKQMSKRRQATVKFRIAKIIMEAELEDAEESNAPVMMPTQNNRNNTSENYIVNSAPQYNHGTTVQNHLSLEDTSLPRYTFANTLNDNAADFSNNESVSSVNFVVECLESLNSESNYFE